MRCYLLLRNNRESGPFTFEELTAQSLAPTDLIWIEGQSVTWLYPTELEALQPYVSPDCSNIKKEPESSQVIDTSKGIFVALPPKQQSQQNVSEQNQYVEQPTLETQFLQPLEQLKENHEAYKKNAAISYQKTFSKTHIGVWLASVFAGLLLAAGLIKKIVAAYQENTGGTAVAALPVHDMDHLKSSDESLYQNALTTEYVPVDTVTMKPVKKAPAKVNLKKLVRVEANDYKVGVFGGIKNLRLLVTNRSGFILDKVKIDLDYLNPQGDIIKTEHLSLRSVAAKSSKSLKVASQNRGVKIACRITSIQSKRNSEALIHL